MQVLYSTMLSAEQRHWRLHAKHDGRVLGAVQSAHLHFPHCSQINLCCVESNFKELFRSSTTNTEALGCIRTTLSVLCPEPFLGGGDCPKSSCSEEALFVLPELAALPVLVDLLSTGARATYTCPVWARWGTLCSLLLFTLTGIISWVLSGLLCLGAVFGPCFLTMDGPSVYSFLLRRTLIWSKDKIVAGWTSRSYSNRCLLSKEGCWMTTNEPLVPCWLCSSICGDLDFWHSVWTWHASENLASSRLQLQSDGTRRLLVWGLSMGHDWCHTTPGQIISR